MVSGLKLLDIIEPTHTLGDNKKERVLESIWVGFGGDFTHKDAEETSQG